MATGSSNRAKVTPGELVLTVQNFITNVSKSAECPVCLDIPVPPITLCASGHNICSFCRPRLVNCPLCQKEFTPIRNFSMESIVAHFSVECRNTPCEVQVKAHELRDHMKVCEFREISCYENHSVHCFGRMWPFRDYLSHLLRRHRCALIQLNGNMLLVSEIMRLDPITGVRWRPCVMIYKDMTFLLKAMSFGNRTITIWIVALMSEEAASKYRCVIRVESATEESTGAMVNKLVAHSIHAKVAAANASGLIPGDGLVIPDSDILVIPNDEQVVASGFEKPYWIIKCFIEEIGEDPAGGAGAENADPEIYNWALECKLEKMRAAEEFPNRSLARGEEHGAERTDSVAAPPTEQGPRSAPRVALSAKPFFHCTQKWFPTFIFTSICFACLVFCYCFLLGGETKLHN